MRTKILVAVIVSAVLILNLLNLTSAQLTVGVKKGDWIEYRVTFTGTPSPDHSITSARMEILDVQGMVIHVNIVSTYQNGTQVSTNSTLNLQTGQLIDDFIIPANLNTGDKFYDSNVGNITISNTEQRTYAGATRTVVSASSLNNTYIWDQATGISVEGTSTGSDYTMHSLTTSTNIWQAQSNVITIDPAILYAIIVIVVIIIAVIITILAMRQKNKH
jgi:hypothetical protein